MRIRRHFRNTSPRTTRSGRSSRKSSRMLRSAAFDRAAGPQGQHHDSHGTPGHRDRQEGRGHRETAQDGGRDARRQPAGYPYQHRRDPQAGTRRAARGRRTGPAARTPRHVPPRDETFGDEHDAARRPGHQDQGRWPSERRRDRAFRVVSRGPRAAAHVPRRHRLRLSPKPRRRTASSASRSGSSAARCSISRPRRPMPNRPRSPSHVRRPARVNCGDKRRCYSRNAPNSENR